METFEVKFFGFVVIAKDINDSGATVMKIEDAAKSKKRVSGLLDCLSNAIDMVLAFS